MAWLGDDPLIERASFEVKYCSTYTVVSCKYILPHHVLLAKPQVTFDIGSIAPNGGVRFLGLLYGYGLEPRVPVLHTLRLFFYLAYRALQSVGRLARQMGRILPGVKKKWRRISALGIIIIHGVASRHIGRLLALHIPFISFTSAPKTLKRSYGFDSSSSWEFILHPASWSRTMGNPENNLIRYHQVCRNFMGF